jgi:hypothetical protein
VEEQEDEAEPETRPRRRGPRTCSPSNSGPGGAPRRSRGPTPTRPR